MSNAFKFARYAAVAVAAIVATAAWTTGPVSAAASEHCKDVYVKVTNNTGGKVKIIDLDYYDYGIGKNGGWRSEPIKNEVIGKDKVWQATRRLENVKAEDTRIRIKYRVKKKVAYSVKVHKSKKSAKKKCINGTQFEFNLK